VYNGGQGKLVFFFVTKSATDCAGLVTGQTAPYDATVKRQGGFLVIDVPLPPDVSTKVANQPNFYGSLIKQDLTFFKMTRNVHGKSHVYQGSIACKHGKRPYSVTFTAQKYGGGDETQTVSHTANC
jgi:hypothetical protein